MKRRSRMYPTIDMKATGIRIRQLMDERRLTVKDIRRYLNLASVQSIYHWLNGQSMPTIDNLYALSALLGISIDSMIIGSRNHPVQTLTGAFYIRMHTYYKKAVKLNAA